MDQRAASIDGEHPDGRISFQAHFPLSKGLEGCKHDFEAPAANAAFHKIFYHNGKYFRKNLFYAGLLC